MSPKLSRQPPVSSAVHMGSRFSCVTFIPGHQKRPGSGRGDLYNVSLYPCDQKTGFEVHQTQQSIAPEWESHITSV